MHASLRQLVEAAEVFPAAMIFSDEQGRIVLANRRTEEMFGYKREELLSKHVELLVPERLRNVHIDHRKRYDVDPHTRLMGKGLDLMARRKDGTEFPVEISLSPIASDEGLLVVAMIHDISVRKKAEERLRRSEEQLRHSQRMEGIARLADSIVHDFNNLIAVISTQTDLILDELGNHPLRAEIELVADTAEKASGLTRQLLAFSRRQELQPRSSNLNRLVGNVDRILQRLLGENIKLQFALASKLGNVLIDPGQMEQVVMNLAVNARDAMPSGGTLTIQTENVELDSDYARDYPDVTPGNHVMLAVTDTGIGMTEEVRHRVFEPFFTTKPSGGGTGLGLSTVYGIVKQSGGHIWLCSEYGHGTTFRIYFPRIDAPSEELPLRETTSRPVTHSRTILVVEDEVRLRRSITTMLERAGYTVLQAAESTQAMEVCQGHRGSIDVVLTDIGLPGMRGPELVEQLKHIRPRLEPLFMSGFGEDALKAGEALATSGRHIQKPFRKNTLLERLAEVFDAERDA